MSVVENIANAGSQVVTGAAKKLNEIQVDDFMKIMVKELQQQDPFEPMSSSDLLNQIGQIRDIQSALELQTTLKELAANQKLAAATTMLGKLILGINADGDQLSGLVTAVKLEGDTVFLELDSGARINLDNVIEVYSGPKGGQETGSENN